MIDMESPAAFRMLAAVKRIQAAIDAIAFLAAAAQDGQPEPGRSRARRALDKALGIKRPRPRKSRSKP